MTSSPKEKIYQGVSPSNQILEGHSILLEEKKKLDQYRTKKKDSLHGQFDKNDFFQTLKKVEKDLLDAQKAIEKKMDHKTLNIFEGHLSLLKDKQFIDKVLDNLPDNGLINAIVIAVQQYKTLFDKIKNPYIKEKFQDLEGVIRLLLESLVKKKKPIQSRLYSNKIGIANTLYPSDIIQLAIENIKAIILINTGITSHIAIIATSFELPIFLAQKSSLLSIPEKTPLLLNCEAGKLYLNPSQGTLNDFKSTLAKKNQQENTAYFNEKKKFPNLLFKRKKKINAPCRY